jgi:hypothetical protein
MSTSAFHNLTGPQKLADGLYDAAEKFRQDFERAQLSGNYARLDLFKARTGRRKHGRVFDHLGRDLKFEVASVRLFESSVGGSRNQRDRMLKLF